MRKLRYFFCGRFFFFALAAFLLLVLGIVLSVWLPALLAPIAVLERLLALIAAVALCCGSSPAEFKLSGTVLILLLPWVGAAVGFCLIGKGQKTDFRGTMSEVPSSKFPLATLSASLVGLKAHSLKTAEYFPVGREMYLALCKDLEGAKKSVYLEFYIAAEGVFLSDVMEILERKAARGVDVRIILDGFGCALTLPPEFIKEAARRGIWVSVFRPLGFPSPKSHRRDHRKIAVIDGEIAYTGGVNLADEYIGEKIRFGHWKDTALRVTGGAAGDFAALFCRTWNALEPDRPLSPPKPSGGIIPCAVIADGADETRQRAGREALLRLFAGATQRLFVNTPYLAPDSSLMRAMESAALTGVDVRLMIPHIPDKKFPYLLTRSYARELTESGVKVMEYTDGFLHAKSVVSDDVVFVSSYNLDFRSLYLQAECGIAVRQKSLADKVARDFLTAWESGTPLPERHGGAEKFCRMLRLAAPLI